MIKKVIIICSELWRLKNLHYSEHRQGNEEAIVDSIAEFIALQHVRAADMSVEVKLNSPEKGYLFKATHYKKKHITKLRVLSELNNNVNFKHLINCVLDDYFEKNEDLSKINIKKYTYSGFSVSEYNKKMRKNKTVPRTQPNGYGGNF